MARGKMSLSVKTIARRKKYFIFLSFLEKKEPGANSMARGKISPSRQTLARSGSGPCPARGEIFRSVRFQREVVPGTARREMIPQRAGLCAENFLI